MHFKLNYSKIKAQIATWAAADNRLRAWEPKYNSLAGSHLSTTYPSHVNYGVGAGAPAYLPNMPSGGFSSAVMNAMAVGGGVGGAGAFATSAKSLSGANVGAARDLVQEFETRFKEVEKWRSDEWVRNLMQ